MRIANGINQSGAWPRLWDNGPGEWVRDALCSQTDPETFFPEKGGATAPAKLICLRCEVREQCLNYALQLSTNPEGVWGGTSERQRRDMRQGRSA